MWYLHLNETKKNTLNDYLDDISSVSFEQVSL